MKGVSLYIPCYNTKGFIAQCLEGVFKQTYPIDEILVIDDGPGDETAKIVSHYPVTLIRRRERHGLTSARNTAFHMARNDFVAALDADCVPEPDWLEKLMRNFINDGIAGAGGKLLEKYTDSLADKWRSIHMRQYWGEERIINPSFLFGSNNVFKKKALVEIGLYNTDYTVSYEDYDISMRLKKNNYDLIYEPEAVIYHMRTDTIGSILDAHWRWHLHGAGGRRKPDNLFDLCCKTYDNFFSYCELLKEDAYKKRFNLLNIDILTFPHHLYSDIKYYISSK